MRALPWIIAAAGVLVMASLFRAGSAMSVELRAATDSLAVLEPMVDSLLAEANRRDTVLVTITDTIRVTIERTRIVAQAADSALRPTLDSQQVQALNMLQAAHAEEVQALELLVAETRAWGQSWKDATEALQLENDQLRSAYDAEHALRLAIERESRPSFLERVGDYAEKALAAKEAFDQLKRMAS